MADFVNSAATPQEAPQAGQFQYGSQVVQPAVTNAVIEDYYTANHPDYSAENAQLNGESLNPQAGMMPGQINYSGANFNVDEIMAQTRRETTLTDSIIHTPAGIAAGIVDRFGTSLGFLGHNTITQGLLQMSPDGLGDYYLRNKEGLQFAGDIATFLLPATAGAKAMTTGSTLYRTLRGAGVAEGYLSKVFASAGDMAEITASVTRRNMLLASSAAIDPTVDATRAALMTQVYKQVALDSVKKIAGSEALIWATMNTSENLYPSDMKLTDYLLLQGMGVAAGVGIEALFARNMMRKQLASTEFLDAFQAANNPGSREFTAGLPSQRDAAIVLNAAHANDLRAMMANPETEALARSNLNKWVNEFEGQVRDSIQGLAKDGLQDLVARSRTISDDALNSMIQITRKDPTVFIGARAIAEMPATPQARNAMSSELWAQIAKAEGEVGKLQGKVAEMRSFKRPGKDYTDDIEAAFKQIGQLAENIKAKQNVNISVLEPDGRMTPIRDRLDYFQDSGKLSDIRYTFKTVSEDAKHVLETQHPVTGQQLQMGISENLLPYYPGGKKSWMDLDTFEQSAMYAIAQKTVSNFKTGRDMMLDKIVINADTDPFVLDMARSIIRNNPNALSEFNLPKFWSKSAEMFDARAEQASLAGKYKQFVQGMDKFSAQGNNAFLRSMGGATDGLPYSLANLEYAMNIPRIQGSTENPMLTLFQHFYMQGAKELPTEIGSLEHLQGLAKETLLKAGWPAVENASQDLFDFLRNGKIETLGDSMSRPLLKDQKTFARPQVIYAEPQRWNLGEASSQLHMAGQRLEFLTKLRNAPGAIASLVDNITSLPAYNFARNPDLLVEGQQASKGTFTYQNMATRDLNVFQAAGIVSNVAEKYADVMKRVIYNGAPEELARFGLSRNLGEALINLNRDDAAVFSFSQYAQSYRHGFKLAEEAIPVQGKDGIVGYRFKLDPAYEAANARAWKRAFGDTELFAKDAFLPLIETGGPLQMHPAAFEALSAMRDVGDMFWDHANFFRDLYNQNPIQYRNWHLPPENMNKPYVKYIISPAEEGTQPIKRYITANSAAELDRIMQTEPIQELLRAGHLAVDAGDVRRYFHLHDEAFFNMADLSDTIAQTGGVRAGGKPTLEYGRQLIKDMTESIANQIASTSRRTVASMFTDEVQYARMMDHMVTASDASRGPVHKITIFKQYLDTLLGTNYYKRSNSVIYQALNADIPIFDAMLQKGKELYRNIMPEVRNDLDAAGNTNLKPSARKLAEYERLKSELPGSQFPYTDALDFVQKTFKVSAPASVQAVSSALNAFTVNMTLRMFETGRALVDMASNFINMPMAINAMKRQPFETEEQWRKKMAVLGADIGSNDVFYPNPVRLFSKAIGDMFSEEGRAILAVGKQKGNLPEKLVDAYMAVHDPVESDLARWVKKSIDAVSVVSDKGEEWSRGMAYLAGYRLARDGLNLTNEHALHAAANLFMENSVGNYRASNRPIVFQGAIGAPLGLFQTYMWNFYSKLFGFVENKNWRALATTYALQAGVFGASTVPGWQQMQDMYAHAYNGKNDIVDALDAKFGSQLTDLILHGSLSSLPRILGSDGIALYSRGDANIQRMPAFISPDNAAPWALATNTTRLLGALVDQVRTGGQMSAQQTMEALGTYTVNRPLARVFEIAAGVSADKRGNTINADTRTMSSIAARLMGMRTMVENNIMEAQLRNSATMAYQEDIKGRTEHAIRSAIRANASEETMNNVLSKAVTDYLSNGGNPAGVADFIRNGYMAAVITKSDRQYLNLLKNPGKFNEAIRLGAAMSMGDATTSTNLTGGTEE